MQLFAFAHCRKRSVTLGMSGWCERSGLRDLADENVTSFSNSGTNNILIEDEHERC